MSLHCNHMYIVTCSKDNWLHTCCSMHVPNNHNIIVTITYTYMYMQSPLSPHTHFLHSCIVTASSSLLRQLLVTRNILFTALKRLHCSCGVKPFQLHVNKCSTIKGSSSEIPFQSSHLIGPLITDPRNANQSDLSFTPSPSLSLYVLPPSHTCFHRSWDVQ